MLSPLTLVWMRPYSNQTVLKPGSHSLLQCHSRRKGEGHFTAAEVHIQAPLLVFTDTIIRAWGMKILASSLASSDTKPAGVMGKVPPHSLSWVEVYLDCPLILPLMAWMGIWPQIFFFFLWYLAWVEWLLSKDFCLVRLLLSGPLAIKSRLLLEIFSSVLYEILICFLLQHQLWDIWGKKQPREHDVVIWSFNSQLICFLLTY